MRNIGTIGTHPVRWDEWSGAVYVGGERATDASGKDEFAYSKDRALEVARDYLRRASGGR